MHYESEFEVIETINSHITRQNHTYSHFYQIKLSTDAKPRIYVRDLRANQSIIERNPKSTNHYENKLELAYVLYTEIGIHPLHLYFFHDIPRAMWLGYLYGKGYKQKPYKTAEWYDLLHPLPFYPNLKGFTHSKHYVSSYPLERIRRLKHQRRDEFRFSLEWTIASLTRYQNKMPKHIDDENDVLVSSKEAFELLKQKSHLEVISS